MPVTEHLEWIELRQFAGLFQRGNDEVNMPPNAAQRMNDCLPQPHGGLRAFGVGTIIATTGIDATDLSGILLGVYARGGLANRNDGFEPQTDYYALYYRGDGTGRLYRLDETNDDTSWTLIKTFAAGTSTGSGVFDVSPMPQWTQYRDLNGLDYVIVTWPSIGSVDEGVWSVRYDNGTVAKFGAGYTPAVTVHQSRLFATDGSLIRWTDVGGTSFTGSLDVERGRAVPENVGFYSFSPSDLMVVKRHGPIVLVQGDIDAPTVRAMSDGPPCAKSVPIIATPFGVVIVSNHGVFLTDNGATIKEISEPLSDISWQFGFSVDEWGNGTGGWQPVWDENWLFIGPYAYDFRTNAWFAYNQHGDAIGLNNGIATKRLTYRDSAVVVGTSGALNFGVIAGTEGGPTADSYEWRSAPLRSPDGRQVEIREVQLNLQSHDASSQVILEIFDDLGDTIIDTKTISSIAAGSQKLRFLQKARGEMLSVQLRPSATSAEAPTIESIRIGWRPGHLTGVG